MKKTVYGMCDWLAVSVVGGTALLSLCLFLSLFLPHVGGLAIAALLTYGWPLMLAFLASLTWLQFRTDMKTCVFDFEGF